MCDYSLEMYASRSAQEGEKYVTTRFPSGSIGVASPDALGTPVCLQCDMLLKLTDIPDHITAWRGLQSQETVKFIQAKTGIYRDGIEFENGLQMSLQQLPVGIGAEVVKLGLVLPDPIHVGGSSRLRLTAFAE